MIEVLVVEDHAVVRSGLVALLSGELGIQVVGQAADGGAALAEAERLRPGVVLLDIDSTSICPAQTASPSPPRSPKSCPTAAP
ncbi:MerR family transcriptional regulator [Streptomyces sp. F-3]|nr:response regulator [Streptomyces sp. F-3]GAT79331.1 MerR family transcriptional regulator [Streptomyces sp. F-3]